MATLAETLQKSMSTPVLNPAQAGGAVLGTQAQVQGINQAVSGKTTPSPTGPARSAIGEQVAAASLNTAASNQQKAADVNTAATNVEAEQQAAQQAQSNVALDEQSMGVRQNLLQRQQEILSEFTSGARQLDLNKDKSKMEQLGFTMRLSNDKYLNQLQTQGDKARLNDSLSFQEELKRTIYSDEEDLMRDNLDFRRMLNQDARDFKDTLSTIDINTALDIAKAQSSAANQRSMWEGVSAATSAGIAAAGTASSPSSTPLTTVTDSQANTTAGQSTLNSQTGGNFTNNPGEVSS